MDSLRNYLNSMPRADQEDYAARCRTSLGYLRKAISAKQQLGVELVVRLHKQSGGAVRATEIRPDVDWTEFGSVLSIPPFVSRRQSERRDGERRDEERRHHERRGSALHANEGPGDAA